MPESTLSSGQGPRIWPQHYCLPHKSTHRVAIATFWRTFRHDGKLTKFRQPGEGGGGASTPPFTLSTTTNKVVVYSRAATLLLFLLSPFLLCAFLFGNSFYCDGCNINLNPDYKRIGVPRWYTAVVTPFHQDLRYQRYRVHTTATASFTAAAPVFSKCGTLSAWLIGGTVRKIMLL